MNFFRRMIGLISAAVITVTGFSFNSAQDNISLTVDAANFNYPVQEFRIHTLVHAVKVECISKYLSKFSLNAKQKQRLNSLRKMAGNEPI